MATSGTEYDTTAETGHTSTTRTGVLDTSQACAALGIGVDELAWLVSAGYLAGLTEDAIEEYIAQRLPPMEEYTARRLTAMIRATEGNQP